ncbi:anti-sigma factor domain-containing protein [Kocuria rosea]|uniref:anti-sigma factor n=1 Tax=Kocuria rosea TaxID=1275 RepID=UPI0014075C91|nr:anti-sigma factor [Kocuria rosea]
MNDIHLDAGDVHDLAALYAVDALEPAEQAAFETHLPGCPRCREELAGYAEVTAHLAQAVAQPPPPALRATVLGAIHHTRPLSAISDEAHTEGGSASATTGTSPGNAPAREARPDSDTGRPGGEVVSLDARRRRHRRLLAAAAAAVLVPGIALGGWGLGVQSERQQGQLAAQEEDRANRLLAAPDVTTHRIEVEGRTATVVVSQQEDAALFVSTDLPDPGPGREYQLWLLLEDTPVPDVHFTGGQIRTWLDGDVADAGAIAMTIEPAGGSTTPTLPVVAATEI